ncbi:hypothetical protein [Bradyrhizobium stylosanthis]|uniref:Uncharacterized protein n=1 Tax=Bradyrhizobium stylosanthis TaxID=1803665 RepID=A0A560E2P7_9BRAD|nr:hypothetical protein [Bradyrhizobium stylosanthis]TWB03543.1 hypothetical protein FBZ96_10214 [Bradyrhizobium stylosanthis]
MVEQHWRFQFGFLPITSVAPDSGAGLPSSVMKPRRVLDRCSGVPASSNQWKWDIGFYPGIEPGMQQGGSAESFEVAREAFEKAWLKLEPRLTEEHFECWRRDRDFHAWKLRMWSDGRPLPAQRRDGRSTFFCGAPIETGCEDHIYSAHRGIGA